MPCCWGEELRGVIDHGSGVFGEDEVFGNRCFSLRRVNLLRNMSRILLG